MATIRDDQTELLGDLRELVTKSVEANTRLMQRGSDFLRRAFSKEIDLSAVGDRGRDALNRGLSDYIRMSTAHTSKLIDLGTRVAEELLGRRESAGQKPGEHDRAHRAPAFDLVLRGKPGSLCQTAFVLDNDRSETVRARFASSLLVDEAGDSATDAPITFDPPEVEIPAGGKQQVVVALKVPDEILPGTYHVLMTIDGMPGLSFRLILHVEEAELDRKGGKPPRRSPPAAKSAKKSVKKSAKKKGARKAAGKRAKTARKKLTRKARAAKKTRANPNH